MVIWFSSKRPQLETQLIAEGIVAVVEAVGNEIRHAADVGQAMGQGEAEVFGKIVLGLGEVLRQEAPDDVGAVLFQPCYAPGVKGLNAEGSVIGLQHPAGGLTQGGMVAVFRLQLDDEGCLAVVEGQQVHKFGDGLPGALQMVVFQVGGGQVFDTSGLSRGAVQQGIVDDRQIAVLQQMDVQLNAVAMVQSGLEGSHGVFGNTGAVKPPVGIAPTLQVLQTGMAAAAADGKKINGNENQ